MFQCDGLLENTHTFSTHDWSIKYVGGSIDCLYNTILKLEKNGRNILDEQFMFNIFKPLELKPLGKYVKYIFDFKTIPNVSNTGKKVLEKKIKKELFHPTRQENKACLIKEMLNPTKVTLQHLSSEGGRLSWENESQQEHKIKLAWERRLQIIMQKYHLEVSHCSNKYFQQLVSIILLILHLRDTTRIFTKMTLNYGNGAKKKDNSIR